jgi:predicted RNA-binding protein with PIN domain
VIVDGYNLILRSPALKPGADRALAASREKLENLLAWTMGPEVRFIVIYDGAEGVGRPGRTGRVETRFSRPPQTADAMIRTLVEERAGGDEGLTVVTSDLEVLRHARAMGADISLGDLFLASAIGPSGVAGETPEKPGGLSRKEVEEWVERFKSGAKGEDED